MSRVNVTLSVFLIIRINKQQIIQSDLILIFVSLNVSGVLRLTTHAVMPSCEHAEAETVLKCVKHLELIFISGKKRNIGHYLYSYFAFFGHKKGRIYLLL